MDNIKELDILHNLRRESEENYLNLTLNNKNSYRPGSDISAWNDSVREPKVIINEMKVSKGTPSQIYLNKPKLSPILIKKTPRILMIPEDRMNFNSPHALKLPMIFGTKSPIYRYAIDEKLYPERKAENKLRNEVKRESPIKIYNQFTPRSITNIKNAIQISSFLDNQILRSLSSTKKKILYFN